MVCAPGESKTWSLDTMLPVVLGSLAGLLIVAVQHADARGGEGSGVGDGQVRVRRRLEGEAERKAPESTRYVCGLLSSRKKTFSYFARSGAGLGSKLRCLVQGFVFACCIVRVEVCSPNAKRLRICIHTTVSIWKWMNPLGHIARGGYQGEPPFFLFFSDLVFGEKQTMVDFFFQQLLCKASLFRYSFLFLVVNVCMLLAEPANRPTNQRIFFFSYLWRFIAFRFVSFRFSRKAADTAERPQLEQQQQLVPVLEKALTKVSIKYRKCLPDFRFPPVYADTINRLVLVGRS